MSSHEYASLGSDQENIVELPSEIDENQLPVPTAAEIDVLRRRDLVIQATDALEEVFGEHVTVPALLRAAQTDQPPSFKRLQARRALRCIQDIGEKDSVVIREIGEANLYHYVEGVIQYGSSRDTYLGLMDAFGLSAEEATGLYAFRELLADETNGHRASFPKLQKALQAVGLSMAQAAMDPDTALVAFTEAGFIVAYNGGKTYDRPVFLPTNPQKEYLGHHIDTPRYGYDSFAWVREYVENVGITTDEDTAS